MFHILHIIQNGQLNILKNVTKICNPLNILKELKDGEAAWKHQLANWETCPFVKSVEKRGGNDSFSLFKVFFSSN